MQRKQIPHNIETKRGTIVGDFFYDADQFGENIQTGKNRVVIVSHGFGSCAQWNMGTVDALVEEGYLVYVFDFLFGGPQSRSNPDTTKMTVLSEVEDLNDIIDNLKALPFIDSEEILPLGESQGGVVTALTAAQRDDLKKIVLYYPAFCLRDDGLKMFDGDLENCPNIVKVLDLEIGREYYEAVWDIDLYEEAAKYEGRVRIIHGTKDGLVPYACSEKLVTMYKHADLFPMEGADHGYGGEDIYKAAKLVKEFFE